MRISLELMNVGLFQEKTVLNLNEITILCEKNDTGKTTLTKSLYCCIEIFNRIKKFDLKFEILNQVEMLFESIKFIQPKFLNSYVDARKKINESLAHIKKNSENFEVLTKKERKILENEIFMLESIFLDIFGNINSTLFDIKKNNLIFHERANVIFQFLNNLKFLLNDMQENRKIKSLFSTDIENIFLSAFGGLEQINSKFNNIKESNIKLKINDEEFIFLVSSFGLFKFDLKLNFLNSEIGECDFKQSDNENRIIKLPRPDLNKLYNKSDFIINDQKINYFKNREIIEKIKKNILKELRFEIYEKDEMSWILLKNGKEIDYINLSNGVKQMIDICDKPDQGFLRNNVIIIDEVEKYLHPSAQKLLAKTLLLINKELGCKLVLTSHSPVFIDCLEFEARKANYLKKITFNYHENNFDKTSVKLNFFFKFNLYFKQIIRGL